MSTETVQRPADEYRRAPQMKALALAEHMISRQVTPPVSLTTEGPDIEGGTALFCPYLASIDVLFEWQAEFSGEIEHRLDGTCEVVTCLAGQLLGGRFEARVVRTVSSERQLDERRLTGQWIAEHGDRADWSAETTAAYVRAIVAFRLEVAA